MRENLYSIVGDLRIMKHKNFRFLILVVLLMAGVLVVQAGNNRNFRAHLSGDNEVPANDSQSQGQANFKFSKDGSSMHYKLIVANIEEVRAAHVHCAPAGVNGPVGVNLYIGPVVTVNGILAEATVTGPNPGNACGWVDLEDVREAMESGNAYVNVHTNAIPGGQIRGQIH
jgi:hypothetical protein